MAEEYNINSCVCIYVYLLNSSALDNHYSCSSLRTCYSEKCSILFLFFYGSKPSDHDFYCFPVTCNFFWWCFYEGHGAILPVECILVSVID